MLQNYFHDADGVEQSPEIKREKAVNAVLEIIQAGASNSGVKNCLDHIENRVDAVADALQAALEKK